MTNFRRKISWKTIVHLVKIISVLTGLIMSSQDMNWKKPALYARQTGLKSNEKMNTYSYYSHCLIKMVSHIQSNNDSLTLKGLAFARPSSSPLKFAPHECPSRRTLNNYAVFIMKPSRKPLNKFGKPSQTLIIPFFSLLLDVLKDNGNNLCQIVKISIVHL